MASAAQQTPMPPSRQGFRRNNRQPQRIQRQPNSACFRNRCKIYLPGPRSWRASIYLTLHARDAGTNGFPDERREIAAEMAKRLWAGKKRSCRIEYESYRQQTIETEKVTGRP